MYHRVINFATAWSEGNRTLQRMRKRDRATLPDVREMNLFCKGDCKENSKKQKIKNSKKQKIENSKKQNIENSKKQKIEKEKKGKFVISSIFCCIYITDSRQHIFSFTKNGKIQTLKFSYACFLLQEEKRTTYQLMKP